VTAERRGRTTPTVGRQPQARRRSLVEADLRGIQVIRAQIRAGAIAADEVFAGLVTRRADRLLDELLRCPPVEQGDPVPNASRCR
jgi:hypothetical protein